MFKNVNRQTCFLYLGLIRTFSQLEDVYAQIEDLNGKTWTIYANHGELFIHHAIIFRAIILHIKQSESLLYRCTSYIPSARA